jgi:hypothetical protein
MKNEIESANTHSDPAAVFACATSLWQTCEKCARSDRLDLSECYNGMDQLMRVVMAIGDHFERWSCEHVEFASFPHVWPYFLEEKFGETCLAVMLPTELDKFEDKDCLRVALRLGLPVILDDKLPIPVEEIAPNPIAGTGFREFRIQTVRNLLEDGDVVPFVADDEPNDEEFGEVYFGLYGVGEDGKLEHIADRNTYGEVFNLAQKLAPGIAFPSRPIFSTRQNFQK